MDPAGHDRARAADRDRRARARPTPGTGRHDRADLRRDRPSVRHAGHRSHAHPGLSVRLVTVASTPPTPRPNQPLPAPPNVQRMAITIYSWSTSTPAVD